MFNVIVIRNNKKAKIISHGGSTPFDYLIKYEGQQYTEYVDEYELKFINKNEK